MSDPVRILIVEEDETERILLRALVSDIGLDVSIKEVGSIAEAVAALTVREYDLVLLDLKLPNGQGLDVVKRTIHLRPGAVTLVLIGEADEPTAEGYLEEGVADYLSKGALTQSSIRRTVRGALARRRGRIKILNAYGKHLTGELHAIGGTGA
jgi:DNA-binding NtrC family response regulator